MPRVGLGCGLCFAQLCWTNAHVSDQMCRHESCCRCRRCCAAVHSSTRSFPRTIIILCAQLVPGVTYLELMEHVRQLYPAAGPFVLKFVDK